MPSTTTRAFFVKRTAKSGASRRQLHRKFRGLLDGLRGLAADGPENLLRRGFVYAFDACDDRDGRMHLVESLLHARRDRVRLRNPAENIHEDHGRVRLDEELEDRKSTRLNSSHVAISYAVFCLKKNKR